MPNPYLEEVNLPVALLQRQADGCFSLSWGNDAWWIVTELEPLACQNTPLTTWMDESAAQQVSHQLQHIHQIKGSVRFILPLTLPQGACVFDAFLHPFGEDDRTGPSGQVMLTLQDVTQEQHLRKTLSLQNAHHMKTMQQMEQFMSFAAHDLRSPMRNVQMIAALLKEDFVDHGDGKLEMTDMLEDIGIKASNMMDDLLTYSRSAVVIEQAFKFDLLDVQQDLNVVLNPRGAHTLTFASAYMETDQVALRIVLQNLIDNSIKHACSDAVAIDVDVTQGSDGLLEFKVTDNGVGFANPSHEFLATKQLRCDSGFGMFGINRLLRDRGGEIQAVPPNSGLGVQILFQMPGKLLSSIKKTA